MAKKKEKEAPVIDQKETAFLLAAIRVKASKMRPYYSRAIFASIPVQVPGLETFAIDKSWHFYYDPITLKEWGIVKAAGTLIHEINHCLRSHHERIKLCGATNKEIANYATDAEINDDLLEEGIELPVPKLPNLMVTPENLGLIPGRTMEEYYRELYDKADKIEICFGCDKEDGEGAGNKPQSGQGKGSGKTKHIHIKSCGSGGHGHKEDYELADSDTGDKLTPAEVEAVRRAVANEIQDYAKKNRGNVPAGLKRWADQYLHPKVAWNKEFRVYLRNRLAEASGMVDFSYRRMSRRQAIQRDMVLPGFRMPIPKIASIIDTSGSVSQKGLIRAVSELAGVLKSTGRSKDVLVLSVDAEVHIAKRITNPKQIQLLGGGGTDMCKGFEHIKKIRFKPDVVVLITDGETPYPKEPTPYKTICLLVGDRISESTIKAVPPWMKVLVVTED